MITVAATEFSKNFGRYRELVQREMVAVTSYERITGYFISSADFEELQRLRARMPKAQAVEELSQATVQAIAAGRMNARHDHLDALLDD